MNDEQANGASEPAPIPLPSVTVMAVRATGLGRADDGGPAAGILVRKPDGGDFEINMPARVIVAFTASCEALKRQIAGEAKAAVVAGSYSVGRIATNRELVMLIINPGEPSEESIAWPIALAKEAGAMLVREAMAQHEANKRADTAAARGKLIMPGSW